MKTRILKLIAVLLLMMTINVSAQTIAVGPIKTYGVFSTPKIASKLTRLELIKIEQYSVLDEFDMNEIPNADSYTECFGKKCLIDYGKALNVDYMMSGNIDGLGNKIVISLKIIDVNSGEIKKNHSLEFDNQETELQRMIGIVIQEMHDMTADPELKSQLSFKNELITSSNVGRVNNSGPRMGAAYTIGSLNEFLTRSKHQGGLEITPFMTNLGYQFEVQYVGTENFSALFEFIPTISGLEQGKFLPSVSILNGFRFGKSGWEFAFGPSFGLSKTTNGFIDTDGHYGSKGKYWNNSDFNSSELSVASLAENNYEFTSHLDTRGDLGISTRWLMAFGRTFRSGSLNIPVNVFYSSQKNGGMVGMSVGFNIVRKKQNIN